MKKGITITILIIVGIIAATGLAMSAILEVAQAIIGFVVWAVIILVGYFFIKSKVD